ncbi:aldo/keto reductase [Pseudoduganella albidiflava]|uniref:Aldo/keto reductase n=1 Tax=Pseudoduganella albidiflava TaxID=321983 RepID=A0A411WYJ1_9BURK|nr:aldo/keto reductase [Pseudoduganella albidiflava]QBI01763.1 aldo/keto reductase [Pseudoduganella albidiflava]GGY39871.1 aldo/keto reductase [Pseudoduganella albidiflava]
MNQRYRPQRYQPITRLGLGGTGLGDMYHATTDAAGEATVDAAWDAGIRYFDTAPHYGTGLSELRFGQALRRRARDEYTLSTKVGRLLVPDVAGDIASPFVSSLPFRRVLDYTADGARRSVEDSLQRLAIGSIDIVYVHDLSIDALGNEFEHYFRIAAGPGGAFEGLVKLREEGLIKGWGLGVNTIEPCLRALRQSDPDIFLLAGRYTLMEQTPLEELFPLCAERGAHVVQGGPFNSGFLAGGGNYDYGPASPAQHEHRDRLRKVAARHGVDLAAAALQFGLGHPVVVATIPGASSPEHLRRNASLLGIEIPEQFWQELLAEGLLPPDAPVPPRTAPQDT